MIMLCCCCDNPSIRYRHVMPVGPTVITTTGRELPGSGTWTLGNIFWQSTRPPVRVQPVVFGRPTVVIPSVRNPFPQVVVPSRHVGVTTNLGGRVVPNVPQTHYMPVKVH